MTDTTPKPNTFFVDDREIDIRDGETIFRAARRLDIKLPHLCYTPKPGYRPDGNCRVCMVEIEGERVLAASCIRTPTPGMKVKTQTERAKTARRMVAATARWRDASSCSACAVSRWCRRGFCARVQQGRITRSGSPPLAGSGVLWS